MFQKTGSKILEVVSGRIFSIATVVVLLLFFIAGCGRVDSRHKVDVSGRTIRAVATTGIVGDAAAHVGGDRAGVIALMGPGVDPHLYKAGEGDLMKLARADIVFYSGLHLEGKMVEILEKMGQRVVTVAAAEGIPADDLLTPPGFKGAHDPHVWFDVRLWMKAVERIRDGYIELDPQHAEIYRENTTAYLAELDSLDSTIRKQVKLIPKERRVIITAHDAFNYFGRTYGFDVRGLQGISTATEAGTADVRKLAEFIAERQIPAIFIETSIPVRNIEAVREAVRARGFEVMVGGELFSDALGSKGTPEGSYVGMVRHNVDTIVRSLTGNMRIEP